MALDWIGQVAPAAATLSAAMLGLTRGQGRLRRNLRHDAETLDHLPEDSPARKMLLDHVAWQAERLSKRESTGEREWRFVVLGAVIALGPGYLSAWLFIQPDWWRWLGILPAFLAVVGLFGMVDSLSLKERAPRTTK